MEPYHSREPTVRCRGANKTFSVADHMQHIKKIAAKLKKDRRKRNKFCLPK